MMLSLFNSVEPTLRTQRLRANPDGHEDSFTSILIWASLGDWSLPEMEEEILRRVSCHFRWQVYECEHSNVYTVPIR
jgi:hypothetical protein